MFLVLLRQQWKQTSRSPVFQKSLVVNIILGLLIIYFASILVTLGFFADKVLVKLYPGQSSVDSLNSFLLFYFLIDLLLRFMMQDLPVLAVQPYLHLPVRRNRLIHFMLLRSIPSMFNLMMLLVFVPFMLRAVIPTYGTGIALVWLAALLMLTFFNNYLLIYFKRQLTNNPRATLLLVVAVAGMMLLDYLQVLSLRQLSMDAFGALMQQPWLLVVPFGMLAFAYWLNFNFMRAHLYPEEIFIKKVAAVDGSDLGFLHRFGDTGKLIALELKLIWRHKRPKSMIMLSGIMLFYGLLFYRNEAYTDGYMMLIFIGIFMTGMPIFNYGQFVPAWQSGHFDALLTQRITSYQYLQAKYWLFVPAVLAMFLLTLPYGLFGYKIVLINVAAMLFNIGISSFFVLYFAVLNKKRLDLNSGSAFNWQGVGASSFILQLPVLLTPLLIYAPFGYFDMPQVGVFFIGLIGLLGFVFHRQLLQLATSRFIDHKYRMAAGYRQH
ncbi:DUF5687 family protein [uncultured Pontibacter sp.]|uniref:DUF5687 family protein n=1 Tax=uncultured Pontibacter sp. TaxID=453356 RepID=UPI002612702C|nr:DUF5687 family protein [uncultured Pontibacter sp.]